jgi:hypothetical protein
MGQLQPDDRSVARPAGGGVGRHQLAPQGGEVVGRAGVEHQLAGVGPPVGPHGRGLGPHDAGAPGAEALPAPADQVGRAAVGAAVPPLHRQDAEPVGRLPPGHGQRPGQGPGGVDLGVHGQVDVERGEAGHERVVAAQRAHLDHVAAAGGGVDHGRRL